MRCTREIGAHQSQVEHRDHRQHRDEIAHDQAKT
jgi:hypothetical protein